MNGLNSSEQVTPLRTPTGLGSRLKDISSLALFLGELISNPRSIGAPVPSSRALANRMASYVPPNPAGFVIELGPGTGVITRALLERGVPAEKLILIERSYEMAKSLRRSLPGVKVAFGDAVHLPRLLAKYFDSEQDKISHVVSSLPLRSLPKKVVEAVTREVRSLLCPGGLLIQYTYDLRHGCNGAFSRFQRVDSRKVWLNLPPARVDVFSPRLG